PGGATPVSGAARSPEHHHDVHHVERNTPRTTRSPRRHQPALRLPGGVRRRLRRGLPSPSHAGRGPAGPGRAAVRTTPGSVPGVRGAARRLTRTHGAGAPSAQPLARCLACLAPGVADPPGVALAPTRARTRL